MLHLVLWMLIQCPVTLHSQGNRAINHTLVILEVFCFFLLAVSTAVRVGVYFLLLWVGVPQGGFCRLKALRFTPRTVYQKSRLPFI